ncbi:MAG TPA: hypothetical protein DCM87_17965 [Planctomycetes bacterium]|nr:hypothetical protein [Planctomycetota bacterium]
MPAHATPVSRTQRTLRPRASPRRAAAVIAAALLIASARADDGVPHRRLATERFPGRQELNNPLGAYFPELEQLDRALRIARILDEEAERLGIELAAAPPDFFADQVEALSVREPDLLAALPDLARAAELASPAGAIQVESIRRLAEALEASPYRETVERFFVSSALRARSDRSSAAFTRKLKDLAEFLRNAGVSESHLDGLRNLYRRGEGGARRLLANLRALTSRAAGRASALKVPPLAVPLVLAAAGALGVFFFLRRKERPEPPPPPLPDFRALGTRGEDFAEALLAFYRRVLHDAGLPFRGRVLADLARDASARRPEIAAGLPPLNRAFYEIWYGKAEKPPGEVSALAARLAALATATHLARQE